ncbi:MAG: type VI secretion system tip protein TssI/VgrG [Syntrophales bacterium]
MNYFTAKKFSFISKTLPEDTFGVISMKGSEGISKPYEFEIMLVSDNLEIDFDVIMQNTAKLVFHRETGGDAIYNGIITHFEHLHAIGEYAFYRAYLVPRLWWLSITKHNQIILDKSLPEFAQMVLIDGGLTTADFEFRLQGAYDPIEYVCQYNESHLNFLSRWLEREGIYYYFDQTESGEKVIFTDTRLAHTELPAGKVLTYSPPSGLEALRAAEVVASFHCRRSLMPEKVFLKDYNYRKPSLEMSGEANVDPQGRGTVFFYNEHIKTPEEGKRLAKIRAESILCRREVYLGEGSVPFMLPGFTFTLESHYRKGVNQSYLITDIDHEGNQTGYLLSGISMGRSGDEDNKIYYRNFFTAIPGSVQFRPEAKTEKPKISGTISGMIDASGSGQYAELDPQGRYKIVFPFDLSGRTGGKASNWVRMAQPYAGTDHGMHFPLHKGTEVLITFIDGDPDRPIIAGAVTNPETPSPVSGDNQTKSRVVSASGNEFHMEDAAGSERILLNSPKQQSFIRIGAPNDPPSGWNPDQPSEWSSNLADDNYGFNFNTAGQMNITAGTSNEIILGEATSTILGLSIDTVIGLNIYAYLGGYIDVQYPAEWKFAPESKHFRASKTSVHGTETKVVTEKTDLVAEHNEVVETKVEATVDKTQVHAEEIVVVENQQKVVAEELKVGESRSQVVIMWEKAIVEDTNVTASKVDTVAEQVEVKAAETKTTGESVVLQGSEVKTSGEITQTSGVVTEITGEDTKVAGLVSIV